MNPEIIEYSKRIYNLKYPKLLLIIGVVISLFKIKVSYEAWFAVLSTIAQVFGALIALAAMFLLFRFEVLENKLADLYKRLDDVNIDEWIKLKHESNQYSEAVDDTKEGQNLKFLSDYDKYKEADQTIIVTNSYIKSTGDPKNISFFEGQTIYKELSYITFRIKKIITYKTVLHRVIPKLRYFIYLIIICMILLSIGSINISDTQDRLQKSIIFLSNFVKLPILGFIIGIAVSELLEFINTINDMVIKYE